MRSLAVVILAAGLGRRMKSSTPKVLQPVCGKPLLSWVLETALALIPQQILVLIGPDQSEISQKYATEKAIQFGIQPERKGTGHALQCAFPLISSDIEHILVLYGDTPLVPLEALQDFYTFHLEEESWGSVITTSLLNPFGYGRIVKAGDQLLRIVEEKDASEEEKRLTEINTGVCLFRREALVEVLFQLKNENRQNEYYLTDLFGLLAERQRVLRAWKTADFKSFQGVNSFAQLAEVQGIAQERILAQHMAAGVHIVDPRTTYIDSQVRIGANTQILPCTVISGAVEIGSFCVIGPFSHLREGTILEEGAEVGNFTEVKKSTLGAHSKAKHLSYLGDAQIGKKVNIGAGTITANYDGKVKSITRIEDYSFIGSGTTLVAPVNVGSHAITGANSVILRGRDVPAYGVVGGVPAKMIRQNLKHEEVS
jgi:bifunctional UDP-N-acetylglucosamine pyrophosphorylase/glucosamine-1-phosphate N-acetyltransferase